MIKLFAFLLLAMLLALTSWLWDLGEEKEAKGRDLRQIWGVRDDDAAGAGTINDDQAGVTARNQQHTCDYTPLNRVPPVLPMSSPGWPAELTLIRTPETITPPFYVVSTYSAQDVRAWVEADGANFDMLGRGWKRALENLMPNRTTQYPAVVPGSVCMDVGGNHGWYSVAMALLGCSEVHYFEPQVNITSVFAAMASINRVEDAMVLHPAGVGDAVTLGNRLPIEGEHGAAFLNLSSAPPASQTTVPVITLDTCFGEVSAVPPGTTKVVDAHNKLRQQQLDQGVGAKGGAPSIPLAKIDVEGWEVRVLRGMWGMLSQAKIRSLLIEIGPARWQPQANVELSEGLMVFDTLTRELGYRAWVLFRGDKHCPRTKDLEVEMGRANTSGGNSTESRLVVQETLSGHDLVPVTPWQLKALLHVMHNRTFDCNFWFEAGHAAR